MQAVNIAVIIASTAMAGGLLYAGIMTGELLAWSCLAAIPAVTGVIAGNFARSGLPAARFRTVTLVTLLIIAVALLDRNTADQYLANLQFISAATARIAMTAYTLVFTPTCL